VLGFTYYQAKEWIDIGFQPRDHELVASVKNDLGYGAETILNREDLDLKTLRFLQELYQEYSQKEFQANIQLPLKK
jgi:hypothetical protein